ncbi:MAG: flippase [Candidatus Staskawiczbacteria bacterium]|nr:flippase [Candidatus Staskawiczbacteria bacterium]
MLKIFQNLKNLFLNNIGVRQTIVKNTFWLVLGEVSVRVLGFILAVYIIRMLGATEYGKFIFAFSFVSIMAIFSDLGIIDVFTREFSRSRENEKKFDSIFTLEIILCALVLTATFIISSFITKDLLIRRIMWILIVYVLSANLFSMTFIFLRARQKMEYEAAIKIFHAVVNAIVVLFIIFNIPSAVNLSYGYMFSNLAVMCFVLLLFNVLFHRLSLKWERKSLDILKISWPLSLGFTVSWIYISISSVMLGFFGLIIENGWYSAASKIALVAIVPADLIIRSFYPALSNFFVSSKQNLQKVWEYLMELMILLALPIIAGGIALSGSIIRFFYGPNFGPSVLALQLLIFVAGISFINYPYSVILIVSDHQKRNFGLIIAGAVLNIILNFLFIPVFGFYGVIISTIISCFVVLASTIFLSRKLALIKSFNKNLLKTALISLFSSLVMYSVISLKFISGLNVIFVFGIGVLVYGLLLLVFYRIIFPEKLLIFKKLK